MLSYLLFFRGNCLIFSSEVFFSYFLWKYDKLDYESQQQGEFRGQSCVHSHPAGDLIICFIYCRVTLVPTHQTMGSNQRHILRDRRPGTTACPGQDKPRQDKNLLYWQNKPNEPTNEGPLSFVLHESPLASVSTVRRGHPSLASLEATEAGSGGC
jgi:hypothetical protein